MRILQVLPHLSKGGAERVVVELSNALHESGHDVTLLLAYPVNFELNQKDLDARIQVQFVSRRRGNRILQYLKVPYWILRNRQTLRNYDVIHCHLTYGLIFGFYLFLLRHLFHTKKPRLVATCHVVGVGITRVRRILNERLSYFFDAFVLMAQDSQWRSFISRKRRTNIQIIVNGITPSALRAQTNQPSTKSAHVVGTISRLQAERKPWLFLEVFAQIQELAPQEVRFILGGEGPERDFLKALSEKLQLTTNFSMPGLVKNPSMFLKDLVLYVTLNVEEITGIAGLEAVFSGIPVVGIQLSPTYTSGPNDWIWSHQDPKSVAIKIVELLANPAEIKALANKQYQIATEKFSIARMKNDYIDLYEKIESK